MASFERGIRLPKFGRILPLTASILMTGVALSGAQPLTPLLVDGRSGQVLGAIDYIWPYLFRGEPEVDVQLKQIPLAEYIDTHLSGLPQLVSIRRSQNVALSWANGRDERERSCYYVTS